jgi:phage tail protein X
MGVLETLGKAALKMKIFSFKKDDFKQFHSVAPILINPENYTLDYQAEYDDNQALGTTGTAGKFFRKTPSTLTVDILFDASGVADGLPRPTVMPDVELLQRTLLHYDGDKHNLPYVAIVWGTLIFKGRCKTLNLSYKLFSSLGLPLRVVAKCTFTGHVSDILRLALADPSSPDLTHYRVIKDGDTLPQMCYDIYGDTKYYTEVARANNLANFRKIKTGTELFFPPILKTTE